MRCEVFKGRFIGKPLMRPRDFDLHWFYGNYFYCYFAPIQYFIKFLVEKFPQFGINEFYFEKINLFLMKSYN